MEPTDHDMTQHAASSHTLASTGAVPGCVLIVTNNDHAAGLLTQQLATRTHRCHCVRDMDQAQREMNMHTVDVVLLDAALGVEQTLTLLARITSAQPATRTIMFARGTSTTQVLQAVRNGAVDFVDIDTEIERITPRVDEAVGHAQRDRRRELRLERLKRICHELNNVRHEVSDQVQSLCDELVTAYQEMAVQIDDVTIATEFRTLLQQELDAEDLLRTALEYLLTKTGPTNLAVFLPDEHQQFNLGAYVNFDCPRDSVSLMLDHLCDAICPQMADEEEIVSFNDARDFSQWIGFEASFLEDSQIVALSCRHEGECLAILVLFRSAREPFTEELAGTLDLLRSIFAQQLSKVIHLHHRAKPAWPDEADDDEIDFDDFGYGFGGGIAA